jgi:hypothetical protein
MLMRQRGFIKTPTRRIGEVSWKPRQREVRQKAELRRETKSTFDFFFRFISDEIRQVEEPCGSSSLLPLMRLKKCEGCDSNA